MPDQDPDQDPASDDDRTVERDVLLDSGDAGRRLDQTLSQVFPEFSRGRIQAWIEAGMVRVDDAAGRSRQTVRGGERVRIRARLESVGLCEPEPVPLDLVFEDEHLLVIDKPAGLVVHPAAGNWSGTLQNGLLYRQPALAELPRCGIVHRLDKDTSGLLVVAKTLAAHKSLVEQLQARTVKREYRALVVGELVSGGRVEAPIGRHPARRTAMAVVSNGRPAVTDYRVLRRVAGHSLLAVQLQTGRTHQIRVHMAHIRHPIVGDPLYGGRPRPPRAASPDLLAALSAFPRQALHAIRLGLLHPASGEPVQWEVPMASDLARLLERLEAEDVD